MTTTESLEPLRTTFRQDGFDFRLLQRAGKIALLSKRKPMHNRESLEVVVIQVLPARTFPNGKHYPAHEGMPSNEAWGLLGWTFVTLEGAQRKFDQLVERSANAASLVSEFSYGELSEAILSDHTPQAPGRFIAGF